MGPVVRSSSTWKVPIRPPELLTRTGVAWSFKSVDHQSNAAEPRSYAVPYPSHMCMFACGLVFADCVSFLYEIRVSEYVDLSCCDILLMQVECGLIDGIHRIQSKFSHISFQVFHMLLDCRHLDEIHSWSRSQWLRVGDWRSVQLDRRRILSPGVHHTRSGTQRDFFLNWPSNSLCNSPPSAWQEPCTY